MVTVHILIPEIVDHLGSDAERGRAGSKRFRMDTDSTTRYFEGTFHL